MRKALTIIFASALLAGCGGKSNNPTPQQPPPTPPSPAIATLQSPAQNAPCTNYDVISTTESNVTFSWNASDNTSSYELDIKNLLDNSTITPQTTKLTKLAVKLSRNTPYSWYIVSISDKTSSTAQSDTWKFYNPGPGAVTYAPFPADLISPALGGQVSATAGAVSLTWSGSAVGNNITGYDLYFSIDNNPALLKSSVTDTTLNVDVISGKTYYWKVVTKDSNGNSSNSEISEFGVK